MLYCEIVSITLDLCLTRVFCPSLFSFDKLSGTRMSRLEFVQVWLGISLHSSRILGKAWRSLYFGIHVYVVSFCIHDRLWFMYETLWCIRYHVVLHLYRDVVLLLSMLWHHLLPLFFYLIYCYSMFWVCIYWCIIFSPCDVRLSMSRIPVVLEW